MNHDVQNGKNLTTLVSEIREDLIDFVETRLAMFIAELREKVEVLTSVFRLGAIGALLLLTSYLLLTLAMVGLVVAGVDNRYRWAIAFGAVGLLWGILGAIVAYSAKRDLELKDVLPKRTLKVLKEDKLWIQSEAKHQI